MTSERAVDGWEELRRLAEAASPGPWAGCAHVAGTDTDCPCRYRGDVVSKATDEVLLQMRVGPDEHPGAPDNDSWKGVKTTDVEQGYANGRYIAAVSPEVVLRLLAAARGEPPEPGLREAALERLEWLSDEAPKLWWQPKSPVGVNGSQSAHIEVRQIADLAIAALRDQP